MTTPQQEVPKSVLQQQHQHQRPPKGRERDLSSSRAAKTGNNNGGNSTCAFDHSRNGNVTNHLPISAPVSSPLSQRRVVSRRPQLVPEESPRRQLPFNPAMTRKTAVTPRACRKAVVTEVRTDQARVVHQITSTGGRSIGLPKFHLNEQPSTGKCRNIHCKSSVASARTGAGCGAEKSRDNSSQQRTTLNSHTISSMNKIVKSSMSSSNTSRDTSIESIVPKYKTIGLSGSPKCMATVHVTEDGVSGAQKRSYNPQLLARTNKFVLNDEKVVSRKTNVVIPRIRSSLNEQKHVGGSTTHNIAIYRDLAEKVTVPTTTHRLNDAFKLLKENRPVNNCENGWSRHVMDQCVPGQRTQLAMGQSTFYDDCDRDFFNREASNESLYIDFSKKRSPFTNKTDAVALSPLRPINKDALLQRGLDSVRTCDYTYQFETTTAATKATKEMKSTKAQLGGGKVIPSVFYVSCASWMPKCNNKFSLRERRLREESKTISRKR